MFLVHLITTSTEFQSAFNICLKNATHYVLCVCNECAFTIKHQHIYALVEKSESRLYLLLFPVNGWCILYGSASGSVFRISFPKKIKNIRLLPAENTARWLIIKSLIFDLFVVFLQTKNIANYLFVVDNFCYTCIFDYLLDNLIEGHFLEINKSYVL